MTTNDRCCSINPYFRIHENRSDEFRRICEKLVERAIKEPKCLYYGFSFYGDVAHCREGFEDAEGILYHMENVSDLLEKMLEISDLISIEIHGIRTEIEKLKKPFADMNPKFYELEYGFRR